MKLVDIEELISDFARFYILVILYEGPAHGYSILRKFRARVGRPISPGVVYPFLQRLQERGLLTYTVRPVGKKERKLYSLTEEGVSFCNQLFRRFSSLVSTAIEPSLETCANCGCKIYEGGYTEVINGVEKAFCCVHCAEAYKRMLKHQGHLEI
ncbi:MAG: PadR family transcriptional regulator [Candidatus Bathyarchaeia archaeon]|nr:PadR family transcriptional regulator [Candidatus Bathyarchaeota archaeon]